MEHKRRKDTLRTQLPDAYFQMEWSPGRSYAETTLEFMCRPSLEPGDLNLFLEHVIGVAQSRFVAWSLWLFATHPVFPLLCLEDPSLPLAVVATYEQTIHHVFLYFSEETQLSNVEVYRRRWLLYRSIVAHYDWPLVRQCFGRCIEAGSKRPHIVPLDCPTPPLSPLLSSLQIPNLLASLEPLAG